jgi:hypothetical protein
MDYKHHYGFQDKHAHSFGGADFSDFGSYAQNGFDAHSYLYGPHEFSEWDVFNYLHGDLSVHPVHSNKTPAAEKFKSISLDLGNSLDQEMDLSLDQHNKAIGLSASQMSDFTQ